MKLLTAIILLASPTPAFAQVHVTNAWARATPPGAANGVIYLTLTSKAADRLTAVATPVARSAGLHAETEADGVMHMAALPAGIALPAGQSVALKPGGLHIMLEGLTSPLQAGGSVRLHLSFAHAAPQDVQAKILPIGSSGPDDSMAGMAMTH